MSDGTMQDKRVTTGEYKKVAELVREWIPLHIGERFGLEQIYRDLQVVQRQNRQYIAQELRRLVLQGDLIEKLHSTSPHPSPYRVINKDVKTIDWINAEEAETIPVVWPYGRADDSHFGFDGHVCIHPGDVIVVAGRSNVGKTTVLQNFLWDNMDRFRCFVMANEYVPSKFKSRTARMTWANPLNDDGTAKFGLIDRRDGWADVIEPDSINIIDWMNVTDNFYQIGAIIEGIQAKLSKGIVMIAIQKNAGAELGRGGSFSEDLSSLYLSLDFNRLTVRKAKDWYDHNPNHEMYGFEIVNGGTQFHNIRKVVACRVCRGSGQIWCKGSGQEKCGGCAGVGYIDARESEDG